MSSRHEIFEAASSHFDGEPPADVAVPSVAERVTASKPDVDTSADGSREIEESETSVPNSSDLPRNGAASALDAITILSNLVVATAPEVDAGARANAVAMAIASMDSAAATPASADGTEPIAHLSESPLPATDQARRGLGTADGGAAERRAAMRWGGWRETSGRTLLTRAAAVLIVGLGLATFINFAANRPSSGTSASTNDASSSASGAALDEASSAALSDEAGDGGSSRDGTAEASVIDAAGTETPDSSGIGLAVPPSTITSSPTSLVVGSIEATLPELEPGTGEVTKAPGPPVTTAVGIDPGPASPTIARCDEPRAGGPLAGTFYRLGQIISGC